jgi:hypothetical protein
VDHPANGIYVMLAAEMRYAHFAVLALFPH